VRGAFALLVVVLAGCGTGGMADESASSGNGQELFQQKCGACHTLADAGTRGTVGPSLDDAFAVPIEEGFDESSIREVVLGQMRYPIPPMPEPDAREMFPPGEYTDDERDEAMNAIAIYVASVASRPRSSAAGGGGAGGGDASDPKSIFTSSCGSCHAFTDAGTAGTIGPNLDESTADVAAMEEQIRKGGNGMPPFEGTLTDEQIAALAQYLAENR
jgi:mono/diheme cytochrome c family protein